MDEDGRRISPLQCHSERVDHELRSQVVPHRPAHDLSRPGIDHAGEEEEAPPGGDVGDVRDPEESLALVLTDEGVEDVEEVKELTAAGKSRRGVTPLQTT
jgi:hypothetical protein